MMAHTTWLLLIITTGLVGRCRGQAVDCPPEGGYFRHESRCNMFYQCVEGEAEERKCPGILHFRQTTPGAGYCDLPRFVKCQLKMKEEEVEKAANEVEKSGGADRERFYCPSRGRGYFLNGYFPDPYNCTRFFLCIDGEYFHMTCPESLIYVANRRFCDWSHKARCLEMPRRRKPTEEEREEEGEDEEEMIVTSESENTGEGEVSVGLSKIRVQNA